MVAVPDLIKRGLPGLVVAAVAVTSVVLFDRTFSDSNATSDPTVGGIGTGSGSGEPSRESNTTTEDSESCAGSESETGPAISTPWGPVQVVVEVVNGDTVCGVEAVQYPDNDRKSSTINARAIPALNQLAAVEGTEFDSVSGATYTSEAYRDSLQAVLDEL